MKPRQALKPDQRRHHVERPETKGPQKATSPCEAILLSKTVPSLPRSLSFQLFAFGSFPIRFVFKSDTLLGGGRLDFGTLHLVADELPIQGNLRASIVEIRPLVRDSVEFVHRSHTPGVFLSG